MTELTEAIDAARQAIQGSDLPSAIAIARAALDRGLEHPLLLNLRALGSEQDQDLQAALNDLLRARELAPSDASIANALGLCLARLGRSDEALAAFGSAIELLPGFAAAHFNKGWLAEEQGDLVEAAARFQDAARVNPGHADALGRYALVSARRGDWDAASDWSERALAVDPAQASAQLALARVAIARGAPDRAESRMQDLLRRLPEPAPERAMVLNALGDALDAQDRTDEAFQAYTLSNANLQRRHAAQFEPPAGQRAIEYVRWLRSCIETAPRSAWSEVAPSVEPQPALGHVFLLGFPRSGTTLLETVLAGHPSVALMEEREALADSVRALMGNAEGLERLAALSPLELEFHRNAYWEAVKRFGVQAEGKVFVDKMPLNTLKLPLIGKLFPQAAILFAIRDPRDVVLSCFRRQFRINASMFELLTLDGAADFYAEVMGFGALCFSIFDLRVHTHRYEDLVEDFERSMRSICRFTGLDWNEGFRGFADRAAQGLVATPSSPQVAQGLYRDGVGQWRRYRRQLEPVLSKLAPWIERYGYPSA